MNKYWNMIVAFFLPGVGRFIPTLNRSILAFERFILVSIPVTEILPLPTKYKVNNRNIYLFYISVQCLPFWFEINLDEIIHWFPDYLLSLNMQLTTAQGYVNNNLNMKYD